LLAQWNEQLELTNTRPNPRMFRVCYQLTMMFQPIYLVRIDERTNNIVVLAGEEIQIAVDRKGARDVS
jgi:hypothetical protein